MTRSIAAILIFIFVAAFETSLLASLPKPFSFIPLVLILSIYIIQHSGSTLGIWWLAGYGLYLDIMRIGNTEGETLIYGITGILAFVVSQKIFSNRSLYGVLGCGLFALILSTFLHFSVIFIKTIYQENGMLLVENLYFFLYQALFLVVLLMVIFIITSKLPAGYLRLHKR